MTAGMKMKCAADISASGDFVPRTPFPTPVSPSLAGTLSPPLRPGGSPLRVLCAVGCGAGRALDAPVTD
jgi:hypothetical protein